jgi:hypothetical protein
VAAVVGYWQLPEDEREFLNYLDGTGQIVAMPHSWVRTPAEMAPEDIESFITRLDPSQLYFGPAELQDEIEAKRFGDEILFGVPAMKASVFHYARGRVRGGELALSSLSVYSQYPSDDEARLVSKGDDFIKWSRRILNWVRRKASEKIEYNSYPYRATRRVKNAVSDGALRVGFYS